MNANKPALKRPDSIKQLVMRAFDGIKSRPELDLLDYKCVSVGKWLEFKVTLHGPRSFRLFFGQTRNVLRHCRRMCRNGRNYVQGVAIGAGLSLDEIKRKITNCILSVRTALGFGNTAVTDQDGLIAKDLGAAGPAGRHQLMPSFAARGFA